MADFPPLDWAAIAANFPRVIADLLSDHNLANHPLAIIPIMDDGHIPVGIARDVEVANLMAAHILITDAHHAVHLKTLVDHPLSIIPAMDDGHIPDLETLSFGGAFADGQIPDLDVAKITSGRFGMARMPAGTATYLLTAQGAGSDPAYAAAPAVDVGGLYGLNVETLTGDKTLTVDTDEIYQYLNPDTTSRTITLSTVGASVGDRFIIRHNGPYNNIRYLTIKQVAATIEIMYALALKGFIFDGTNWIPERIGTGQHQIPIGYEAKVWTDGVAIGQSARADSDGTAVGWSALGYGSGVAIGNAARGYTYGVGIGGSAYGYSYGVAIGNSARTNIKRYSIALGYRSRTLRTSETATNIDGDSNYKNQVGQARWAGETTDENPLELLLGARPAERFLSRVKEAVAFTGLVVATDQYVAGPHHDTKAWKVEGLIKANSGGTYSSVAITHAVIGNDAGAAAWDAVFSVSGSNLILTVTGAAGVTIRWVGKIDYVEVVW